MTATERKRMKDDIAFISAFYGLSKESHDMAYLAAETSERARSIYRKIRESIEKERQ
jgi:DNA-binding phage protein